MLFGRVDDKFAVDSADVHARYRSAERNIRDAQRTTRANHAGDFGRVVLVETNHRRDNLHVISKAFGEQRANRSVNQSAFQNRGSLRATFALDEAAGYFPCRIHFLFKVDGQREEVNALSRLGRHRCRDQNRRVAVANQHRAVGLLCHFAVLDD